MSEQGFETWGVVEVLGHKTYAGLIREQVVAGSALLRIDVPDTARRTAYTKLFGTGSIYSITPTDEATARLAAERLDEPPISPYIIPVARQLNAPEPIQIDPAEVAAAQAWHDQIEADLARDYPEEDRDDDTQEFDPVEGDDFDYEADDERGY